MSFDSSRFTFDPWNNFASVVMQQGRVQLDSDWNEWLAEFARRVQAGTLDIVGYAGVPAITKDGFKISLATESSGAITVKIGPGRMYVDGVLAENHGLPAPNPEQWTPASDAVPLGSYPDWNSHLDELVGPHSVDYNSQPYYPNPTAFPQSGGPYLVYLDVWQREVTFLEDPDLVEKAVGVDTTGRLQTIWQVKFLNVSSVSGVTCSSSIEAWNDLFLPPPRLTTGVVQSNPSGPCCIASTTGYTGLENQLYRVEIYQPGKSLPKGTVVPVTSIPSGTATFNWSRDNASVATGVTAIAGGTVLTVQSTGKDNVLRFSPNNWVEITDDWLELNGLPGELHQVSLVNDAANTVTLSTAVSSHFPSSGPTDPSRHTRLTRWDQSGKVYESDGTTVWIDLNANGSAGIPVPPPGTTLILENGITVSFDQTSKERPFDSGDYWTMAARTADGTVEYLDKAPPRGIFHHYARLALVTVGQPVTDCRSIFPPLTNLPAGGCCCCSVTVGDGVASHGDFSDIQSAVNSLTGSQLAEVCVLPGAYNLQATVNITRSNLTIRGCPQAMIQASSGPAFQIPAAASGSPAVTQVTFDSLTVSVQGQFPVLQVSLGSQIAVQTCAFTVNAGESPQPWAIVAQSSGLEICNSVLTGGGIWVVDGSSQLCIKDNTITNSQGAGIGLGGLPANVPPAPFATGVNTGEIINNQINGAADSGIRALVDAKSGDITDLLIASNYISGCAAFPLQNPAFPGSGVSAAILLFHGQTIRIINNEIVGNGISGSAYTYTHSVPDYGVWAYDVGDLEIAENLIVDNGVDPSSTASGGQAGIFIRNAFGARTVGLTDALRIHDNEIRTPAGPSLQIDGVGPMSIVNNSLLSMGVWPAGATAGLAVIIYNLGMPLGVGEAALGALEMANTRFLQSAAQGAIDFTLRDGRIQFSGNQVTLGAVPSAGSFPCVFLTLDDLALENNQFEAVTPGVVMWADTLALAVWSLRCVDNRFSEIPGTAVASHVGYSIFNITNQNQATHCIVPQGVNVIHQNNQIMGGTAITEFCDCLAKAGLSGVSGCLRQLAAGQNTVAGNKLGDVTAMMNGIQAASSDATANLKDFAASQTARAARLTAVRDRLQQSPQPPTLLLQKLNQQVAATSAVAQAGSSLAERIAARPTVAPADLAVFGRVLAAPGTTLPQVWVRLTDQAGSLSVGSRVKADASGDFSLVFKSCEIPAGAALVVAVEDANGARLVASGPVTLVAGSPAYVELALTSPPATTPTSSTPAATSPSSSRG